VAFNLTNEIKSNLKRKVLESGCSIA